jgi:ComF family protein
MPRIFGRGSDGIYGMSTLPWIDRLLNFFFPDYCVQCGQMGTLYCAPCSAQLRPYPLDDAPEGLDAVAVAWLYEGGLRKAIHRMKYARIRRMAEPLGRMIATVAVERLPPADAVVPVPLHAERRAERGFNQAEELAREVARRCGLPLLTTGLERRRATGHQAGLSRAERRTNIAGAFVWRSAQSPPARIILIDDVLTTGATLVACADALRAAGSCSIYAAALARSLAQDRGADPDAQKGYATIEYSAAKGASDVDPSPAWRAAADRNPISPAARGSAARRSPGHRGRQAGG